MDSPELPTPVSSASANDHPARFKATTYFWFVLLCLGAVWSRLPEAPRAGASLSRQAGDTSGANNKAGGGARLDSGSAQSFSDFVKAEQLTRSALAAERVSRGLMNVAREAGKSAGAPRPSRPDDPKRSSQSLYTQAIQETRSLAQRTGSVNLARRAIILEHAAGRPLDTRYLQATLAANLKNRGKSEADIQREVAFWQQLYSDQKKGNLPAGRSSIIADTNRLLNDKDTDLGLLDNRVRADAYEVAGDTRQAANIDAQVTATATRSTLIAFSANGLMFLAAVVGGIILLVLIVLALVREFKWSSVESQAPPSPILFALLIDSFVFYFALLFVSRPVLGLVARQLLPGGPDATSPNVALYVTGASYLFVHGVGAIYTAVQLRRSGYSLATIGVTGRQVLANLGWGVLGYCTALPLVLGLGAIAGAIFRDNPNVTPNPALPLLTSTDGLAARLVIFLLVAVSAPLFEEFFFRGVLYTGLRARWGAIASILISATLFAIGHPVQDWLPILGLGIVFAVLREWRKSVVPGMVAHFLQNGMTFLALSALFSR